MARLSSFRRFHGNANDLAARRLNRGTRRTKLSVFLATSLATSRRPSGRRPLDLTIVKIKHKSYALLNRACLTLPRFSFLLLAASTFRPIVALLNFPPRWSRVRAKYEGIVRRRRIVRIERFFETVLFATSRVNKRNEIR